MNDKNITPADVFELARQCGGIEQPIAPDVLRYILMDENALKDFAARQRPTEEVAIPPGSPAHSLGGFIGGFVGTFSRQPTMREVWDAAIRSWRDLNARPTEGAATETMEGQQAQLLRECWDFFNDPTVDIGPTDADERATAIMQKLERHLYASPAVAPSAVRMLSRDEIEKVCGFGVTGTAREWDMIDRAIRVFCSANGLTIGAPPSAQPVPEEVAHAARLFVAAGYRGPVHMARTVFDWVNSLSIGATPSAKEPRTDAALKALDEVIPTHLRTSRHGENFMGERYEVIRTALTGTKEKS